MSEATHPQPVAEESQPQKSGIEVPEHIDDATFDELLTGLQGEVPSQEGEAASTAEEVPAAEQETLPEAAGSAPQGDAVTKDQLGQLINYVAQATTQAQNTGQDPEVVRNQAMEKLAEKTGMDKAGLEQLGEVIGEMSRGQNNARDRQIQQLGQQIQNLTNERTVNGYERHLDGLLDRAQVNEGDEFTRRALKAMVTQEGMRRYGQGFNMDQASQLFRQLNNDRVKASHDQQTRYVEDKQETVRQAPPVQNASGTGSAAADILAGLNDPNDKSFDFRGKNFKKLVRNFARDRAKQALG